MLRVFLGTDRKKALAALQSGAAELGHPIIRITDASTAADLRAVLEGGGMFAQKKTIVLDRISDNEELWTLLVGALPAMKESEDDFFIYEEKPLAATKRLLEKNAETVEVFDISKKEKERPSVFSLVNHMRAGDKKKLWVSYQEELAKDNPAEAIHGVLFWGAKQAMLSDRSPKESERSKKLIIALTELPHESRRRGEELEYALERFILTAT